MDNPVEYSRPRLTRRSGLSKFEAHILILLLPGVLVRHWVSSQMFASAEAPQSTVVSYFDRLESLLDFLHERLSAVPMRMTCVFAAFVALSAVGQALAQPFTYQGELSQGGVPANGTYDFTVAVASSESLPAYVGSMTSVASVEVSDGRFVIVVNPGNGVFTGADLWLELAVRPAGSGGGYVTLSPRQKVAATPYAARSLSDRWVQNGAVLTNDSTQTSRVLLNRTATISPLEYFGFLAPAVAGSYGGMYIDTASATALPFYGYATGGVARAWTYFNGPDSSWRVSNLGADRLVVSSTGNIGIGIPSPSAKLDVSGEVRATSFTYATPQVHRVSINPTAFVAPQGNASGDYTVTSDTAHYAASVGFSGFYAPLNLPHGATISSMTMYAMDASASAELSIQLRRVRHSSGATAILGSAATAGASALVQTVATSTFSAPVVDNDLFSYALFVSCTDWAGSDTSIKGVTLQCTVPTP